MDLLQWLYVTLTKMSPLDNYDPHIRREMSANGNIVDKIPLPLWISNKPEANKPENPRKVVRRMILCEKCEFWMFRIFRIQEHHPRMSHLRLIPVVEENPRRNISSLKEPPHYLKHRQLIVNPQRGWHPLPEPSPKDLPVEGPCSLEVCRMPFYLSKHILAVPKVKLGVVTNKQAAPKPAIQNTGGPGRKMTMGSLRSDTDVDEVLKDVLPHCVTAAALGSNVFGQSIDGLRYLFLL